MSDINNSDERREEEGATRLLVPSEQQPTQLQQQQQQHQRGLMSKLFFGRCDGQERLHGSIPATDTLLGGKNKRKHSDKNKAHNSGNSSYSTMNSDTVEDEDDDEEEEEEGIFRSGHSLLGLMSERFFGSAEGLRFPKPTHFKNVDDVLGVVFSFVGEMELVRTCQLVNKQWQYAVATIPSVRLTAKQRVDSYNDHLLVGTKKSNRLALFQICYAFFVFFCFSVCLSLVIFIKGSDDSLQLGFILTMVFGGIGCAFSFFAAAVVSLLPVRSYSKRRAGITLMTILRCLVCFGCFLSATFAVSHYYAGELISGGTMIADCPRNTSMEWPEYIRFIRDPAKSWRVGKADYEGDYGFWMLHYTATTYPDECGPKYAGKKIPPLPKYSYDPLPQFPAVALDFLPDLSSIKPYATYRSVQSNYWFGTEPSVYAQWLWMLTNKWTVGALPLVSDATSRVDKDALEASMVTALIGFFFLVPLFFALSALLFDYWPYVSARRKMLQVPERYTKQA